MKAWAIALVALTIGCTSVEPNAGYEGVITRKPWFVGNGGVGDRPVKTGREYFAWSTSAQYVDMRPQRVDMEFDDLMTSSGVPIDFHAVFNYRVTDSVRLVKEFSAEYRQVGNDVWVPEWFYRNLDQPFRTAVRDEVKRHDMQSMAITASAAEEVDGVVEKHLRALIAASKVPIELIDLSLGRANPPNEIKSQRVATAVQEQRKITEDRGKEAEDTRKAREESRASADAAYNLRMNAAGGANLPPELSLRLKEIEMKREVCSKAGASCTFWFGEPPRPVVDVRPGGQ